MIESSIDFPFEVEEVEQVVIKERLEEIEIDIKNYWIRIRIQE